LKNRCGRKGGYATPAGKKGFLHKGTVLRSWPGEDEQSFIKGTDQKWGRGYVRGAKLDRGADQPAQGAAH